jgi:cytochrome c peroxidase
MEITQFDRRRSRFFLQRQGAMKASSQISSIAVALVFAGMARADDIDKQLIAILSNAGFTGKIAGTLTTRLGRPINTRLADLGRLLWFDKLRRSPEFAQ